MAAENEQNEGEDLSVPSALIGELRRLETRALLVTARDDEAILSRPRLHLARIRQIRKERGRPVGVREEELALAARTEARPSDGLGDLRTDLREMQRSRWWRLPVLIGAVAVGLAGLLAAFLPFNSAVKTTGFLRFGPLEAKFIFIAASLLLFVIWMATRPRR